MQVKLWVSLHSLYAKCIILEKSQYPSVPCKIMQPAKGLSFQRLRYYRLLSCVRRGCGVELLELCIFFAAMLLTQVRFRGPQ